MQFKLIDAKLDEAAKVIVGEIDAETPECRAFSHMHAALSMLVEWVKAERGMKPVKATAATPTNNAQILATINTDRREVFATFHIKGATDETIAMVKDLLETLEQMQR